MIDLTFPEDSKYSGVWDQICVAKFSQGMQNYLSLL